MEIGIHLALSHGEELANHRETSHYVTKAGRVRGEPPIDGYGMPGEGLVLPTLYTR